MSKEERPELNLPAFDIKIRKDEKGREEIWDPCRKKYVVLAPEEWVRQNFIRYMTDLLGYPMVRMKVEGSTSYNQLNKRPDIVFFDIKGEPILIVECKAVHVPINQSVFEQISIYNKTLGAKYLLVTNGRQHFCCLHDVETNKIQFLDEIPDYQSCK